jgi:hypothetical protein
MRRDPDVKGGKPSIGVVYLAWHALGSATFQRFADSYQRQPAGHEHDLIVIYAGFDQKQYLNDAAAVFRDIPHVGIEMPDLRLDIGYYLETARRVPHEYLCFLNTHTELTTGNWLAHLGMHASRDNVGISGTTGSYESLFDSMGLYSKIAWLYNVYGDMVSAQTAYYFGFYLRQTCPAAIMEPAAQLCPRETERWTAKYARLVKRQEQDQGFERYWANLIRPGAVFTDHRRFPAFPNPHVRSNGFMLRRARLMAFEPSKIISKLDACAFESGRDGLTAQVRRAGLAAVLVANDGQGYDVPDWPRSGTFRLGDQSKLILTDNRTRDFAGMPPGERSVHVRITWGDYLEAAPVDFPDFGYAFARGSLDPRRTDPIVEPRSLISDSLYICRKLAVVAMHPHREVRHLRHGMSLLARTSRSAARRVLRATLPPFRRLDERVAADARTIAGLAAEIADLRDRVRSLEGENEAMLQRGPPAGTPPFGHPLVK